MIGGLMSGEQGGLRGIRRTSEASFHGVAK